MKRTLIGLALLAAVAAAAPASAGVVTITSPPGTVVSGWSLLALPGIPLYPDPPTVMGSIPIDAKLYRWDAATQSLVAYDEWMPEGFGNMLLTDGYWLQASSAQTISYTGLDDNDSMDVWISLPKAGWTLFGNPFTYSFPWTDAKVLDGNVTVSMADAVHTHGWLQPLGYWWDSSTQSLLTYGLPDDWPDTDTLLAWHGFWIQTNVDKIALIFESTL